MRRIALFLLVFVLFVVALNIIALPIPYTFASPELTPPFRPTPTGWPDAPFSWQAHVREIRIVYDPSVFD